MVSKKEMATLLTKMLIDGFSSGEFYGGTKGFYIDRNGKRQETKGCEIGCPLFDIDEDYRIGKYKGLYVSYVRDQDMYLLKVVVKETEQRGDIPFFPLAIVATLSMNYLENLIVGREISALKLKENLLKRIVVGSDKREEKDKELISQKEQLSFQF